MLHTSSVAACVALALVGTVLGATGPVSDAPSVNPSVIIDLREDSSAKMVGATWRYRDVRIIEVDHRGPGSGGTSTGQPLRTHDLTPTPGTSEFEIEGWESVSPGDLERRRSSGRLAGGWYRLMLQMPKTVAGRSIAGNAAVLELVVDDYSEVWVNGRLATVLGERGGGTATGWNCPNRVVLTSSAAAGEMFDVAILAVNGPLSQPPPNYVWIRSATLDFYASSGLTSGEGAKLEVVRLDPDLDAVIPAGAALERLAEGFGFTEGPVWVPSSVGGAGAKAIARGYLLFSDPDRNTIYRWTPGVPGNGVSVYRTKSGYTGADIAEYRQPGSNGLALDAQGRLTICEHGNRRVTRLEANGSLTVLADRYQGKRLNSPNDLVYRSDGALYFTDPFFGLPRFGEDPRKELMHQGVYCLIGEELKLVSSDLVGPNGIALSPDERYLYVGNWEDSRKVVMRYDVDRDGTLRNGMVFVDLTGEVGEEAIDGVKTDARGNVLVSGPGGVWVIAADGRRLGLIRSEQMPANFAWGDDDRSSLYLTARTGLYRLRLGAIGK